MPPRPTTTADPAHDEAIFVSVKQTSDMLGLSLNQTYELLNRQLIESRYFGKRRLVLLASVNEFAHNLPTERQG